MLELIKVTPLAAESLGVRSLCTLIETPDTRILIDPSASLGPRYSLIPHPREYDRLRRVTEDIIFKSLEVDLIILSHYHYDHVKPFFTNYSFNWSNKEIARKIIENKTVLAKDFRSHINPNQRRRGYFFNKFASGHAKEIHYMDNQSYSLNKTTIEFSPPFPHGEKDTPLGYVIGCNTVIGTQRFQFDTSYIVKCDIVSNYPIV